MPPVSLPAVTDARGQGRIDEAALRSATGGSESSFVSDFRRWFWARPRAHGEIIEGRRVSNTELLYDLIYVAVISQSTTALGNDLSVSGLLDFIVVFALVWIGWVNGSLYLELHGRDDGRTRSFVFIQMGILLLLAVFTQHAASDTGAQFALCYVGFLLVTAWLFWTVRRFDTGQVARVTGTYAYGLFGSAAVIFVSAFLPTELRLTVWAVFSIVWILATILLGTRPREYSIGISPTESMVERFDTFTLIVLGEIVVGVVAGMVAGPKDALTIATGIVALVIGFSFWWIYFDIVGGRAARRSGAAVTVWILGHLPIAMAIAAAGAGMVSLVEHADNTATPSTTAWLLTGTVAVVLLAEIVLARAFLDGDADHATYRPLLVAMAIGAVASLAVALVPLPPWALALVLNLIMLAVWIVAASRFMRAGAWPPGSAG
jgi:low temperature requirement protein LtrA